MSEDIANVELPEIEITPEMTEAGALVMVRYDPGFANEYDIAAEVFKVMLKASLR